MIYNFTLAFVCALDDGDYGGEMISFKGLIFSICSQNLFPKSSLFGDVVIFIWD